MDFFEKKPRNTQEWRQEIENIQVVSGFFSEMIRENVRAGVLLGLNDAFGDK